MIQVALVAWLPLTALLFVVLRPHVATAASLIFGVAMLPSLRSIPMPVMPDLDQYTVPVLGCFIMMMLRFPRRVMAARPGTGGEALILAMCAGALVTNLTNMDPQSFGANVLPPMKITDTINDSLRMIIRWALPFLFGRILVRTVQEAVEVLMVLAIALLVYLPFILVELQTGPLFHSMVYGTTPSPTTFMQAMKFGGYRPVVLMNHGLTLSVFVLYGTMAWACLAKLKTMPFNLIAPKPMVGGLAFVIAACKSVGVWLYAILVIPTLFLVRPRAQLFAAACIAIVVLAYPLLRSVDMVPIEGVAGIAEQMVGFRTADSFLARTKSEDEILNRTAERYFFGWGGNARYMVYDEVTGMPLSTIDGFWVFQFGAGGLFRFVALFAFLLYPVFYVYRRAGRIRSPAALTVLATLVWIVTLRTFDLLPNSTVDPYLTFMGGAACGLAAAESKRKRTSQQTSPRKTAPSSRRNRDPQRSAGADTEADPDASAAPPRSASLAANLHDAQPKHETRKRR